MTSETQIEAGQALDELIALEVMGWDPPRPEREFKPWAWFDTTGWSDDPASKAFSTSYEGMGLVLERMKADYLLNIEFDDKGASVMFMQGYSAPVVGEAYTQSLPHAVALAALAAVRAS